jgi:Ca2+-binding RTX toxin-like protein
MRGNQSRRRLFVENLETRRLLAAAHADLDAGVLTLSGGGQNDQIQVSGDNTLLTVSFNKQTFDFNTADVTEIHIDGGNGNDWIWVDESVTVGAMINGGHGNDRVHGGGGDDTILGDKGNDRLSGGGGMDTISGGGGNDWAWGDDGEDVVHGDHGNDHVFGGAGNDELFGDVGHDKLNGDDGDDVMSGGYGHDHLRGSAGNDQLFGDEGKDHLWGNDGDDQLFGGNDKDHLWGNLGNDLLKGEGGSDHLDGGAGDNLLDGDAGQNHYKYGFVVDLDQNLVAEMTNAAGALAVATFQYSVENDMVVQNLTVTVENWPVDGVTPVDLDVVIDGQSVGVVSVDVVTGEGNVTLTGLSMLEGSLITVGSDLSGSFVAALS